MCLGGQLFQETRSPVQEFLLVWPHLLWLLNFPERRMVAADTVSSLSDFTHLSKWINHVFRVLLASSRGNLFYNPDTYVLSKLLITFSTYEIVNHKLTFSLPAAKKYVDVLNPSGKSSTPAMLPSSLLPMMPMPGPEFKGNFFVPSPVNTGKGFVLALLVYLFVSPLSTPELSLSRVTCWEISFLGRCECRYTEVVHCSSEQ